MTIRALIWCSGAALMALAAAALPARAASAPVQLKSIAFYNGLNFTYKNCSPTGNSAVSFDNKTKRIYALVEYTDWQGTHNDAYRWYSPNGKLYGGTDPTSYTGSGPASDCGYLGVANADAAHLAGQWRFQLVVDNNPIATAAFTIVAATPANVSPSPSPTPTSLPPCKLRSDMAYYAWRLWRLLDELNTYERQHIDDGPDAVHQYRQTIDQEDQQIWDAIGRYERSHPKVGGWSTVDLALQKVANDVLQASQTMEQDAIDLANNTDPNGGTGLTLLNAPKAVRTGLSDLAQANIVINGITCPASSPASGPGNTTQLTVHASVSPSPLHYGALATLTAITNSGASCAASVSYVSGAAPSLSPGRTVTATGNHASWTWHVLSTGHGNATVTCAYRGKTASTKVTFVIK